MRHRPPLPRKEEERHSPRKVRVAWRIGAPRPEVMRNGRRGALSMMRSICQAGEQEPMSLGARFKSSLDRDMTTLHGTHLAALFSSVVGELCRRLDWCGSRCYSVGHNEISK